MNGRLNGTIKYIAFAILLIGNGLVIGVSLGRTQARLDALTHEVSLFRQQSERQALKCDDTARRLNQHMITDTD